MAGAKGDNLPDEAHPAILPIGSIAIKASWRLLTDADTPAVRARYYVVKDAEIVDVGKSAGGRTRRLLQGRHRAGRVPYHGQDALPAAVAMEHLRAGRQRAAGRRRRGARAGRQGRRRALFLFRRLSAGPPAAPARLARDRADQHEQPAQIRSGADAGDAPPSRSSLDHGDEPRLLGLAGDQGHGLGALHARRQPMADRSPSGRAAKRRSLFPRPHRRSGHAARNLSVLRCRQPRTRRTSSTRRWRPICRTPRRAAWPATPASPTRADAISSASSRTCAESLTWRGP